MHIEVRLISDKRAKWNELSLSVHGMKYRCWIYDPWEFLSFQRKLVKVINKSSYQEDMIDSVLSYCREYPLEYAVVIQSDGFCLAIVDHIHSKSLFYTKKNGKIFISDDPKELFQYQEPKLINFQMLQFLLAGFVPGNKTLLKNIYQIPTAEALIASNNEMYLKPYYHFWRQEPNTFSFEKACDEFKDIFLGVIGEFLQAYKGHKIVLFLSGGMDSRYILWALYELSAKDVLICTYGRPFQRDVRYSRRVVKETPFTWLYIPYTFSDWRKINQSSNKKRYAESNHFFMRVPYFQEFSALTYMHKKHLIPRKTVFINGDSGGLLSGSHLPYLKNPTEKNLDEFIEYLMNRRFNLWPNENLYETEIWEIINHSLRHEFDKVPENNRNNANWYDWWEWRETQSKIQVGAKGQFAWFGHNLFHPYWDKRVVNFFEKIPINYRIGQKFYRKSYEKFASQKNKNFLLAPVTKPGRAFRLSHKIIRLIEHLIEPKWGRYTFDDFYHTRLTAKYFLNKVNFKRLPTINGLNSALLIRDLIKDYEL